MAQYRATRMIGFPLGSSNWAYGIGDDVPEVNVRAYGYDDPADSYVELVDPPTPAENGPASEAQAEADKPAE